MPIGRHCFGDYAIVVNLGMRPNPWEPTPFYLQSGVHLVYDNYSAARMLPHMVFGFPGKLLQAPRLGLLAYLLAMTPACLTPAVWAARGARGLERIVVFVCCSVAAAPAWMAIDRGNSVGFVAPIALVFLVALCRQRWRLALLAAQFDRPAFPKDRLLANRFAAIHALLQGGQIGPVRVRRGSKVMQHCSHSNR
jgi:hypothetical protein